MQNRAFTLIELLIVVAIIAILAAIAVPNFLEAQTRSKVSRTKADMRTCATALEAYDHQDMPFGKLVEILKPDRSMSHPPIFQVMVALQNVPIQPLELPALTVTPGSPADPAPASPGR